MKAINNKLLAAMGLATALSFSGQASAMVIDGINLGSGGPVFKVASTYENIVTALGQELRGYGEITQIVDSNGLVWSAGNNDTILTYVFEGFIVSSISPTHTDFTGGSVKFYTDHPLVAGYTAFTPIGGGTNPEILADFAEASTGNGGLWLSLAGNTFTTGDPLHATGITLHSTGVGLDGVGSLIGGTGTGLLDVVGGAAASVFVKDIFGDADSDGKADAQLGSSFSNGFLPANQILSGSSDIRAEVIPEPSSIALLGLGLSAIGFFASRRRKAQH